MIILVQAKNVFKHNLKTRIDFRVELFSLAISILELEDSLLQVAYISKLFKSKKNI